VRSDVSSRAEGRLPLPSDALTSNAVRSHRPQSAMPTSTVPFTENVIPYLVAYRRVGLGCVLVTLVNVEGSSPRRVGSQMAVAADGTVVGMISSGCAEAAIVAEAMSALHEGRVRTVRYGTGSPYMDVVLPCGSGIDVHFDFPVAN
jgi:xanthine dehydrogenase accessory factor